MDLIFLFLNIISPDEFAKKINKKKSQSIHSFVQQYNMMVYSCSLVSHLGEGQSFVGWKLTEMMSLILLFLFVS